MIFLLLFMCNPCHSCTGQTEQGWDDRHHHTPGSQHTVDTAAGARKTGTHSMTVCVCFCVCVFT